MIEKKKGSETEWPWNKNLKKNKTNKLGSNAGKNKAQKISMSK